MTNAIKITSNTSTNTANKAVIYTEGITDKVVIATARENTNFLEVVIADNAADMMKMIEDLASAGFEIYIDNGKEQKKFR